MPVLESIHFLTTVNLVISEQQEEEKVESDNDDSVDVDEENLFQMIAAAAAAQGIPLEFLAANESDDDEDVEYPFKSRPTSLEDVTSFIQSEACQKILILAGGKLVRSRSFSLVH